MTTTLTIVEGRADLLISADNNFERQMLRHLESLPITHTCLSCEGYYESAPRHVKISFRTAPEDHEANIRDLARDIATNT